MRRVARAVLGLVMAAAALMPAWATTAVERTDTDLIQEATIIVTGRCTHLQSQWLDRTLVTIATISVTEVLKGQAGSVVTVVLPGGIDIHRRFPIAMSYPAAPQISQQESVLLFLTPEDRVPQSYAIVGFSQGKLTVATNAQGQPVASQNLSALNLQNRTGAFSRGRSKTLLLSELRQKIQQTLAGAAPGSPRR